MSGPPLLEPINSLLHPLQSLSWNDEGTKLYILGEDQRRVWIYQPAGGEQLTELSHRLPHGTRAIQVRPDGNLLVLTDPPDPHAKHDVAFFQVFNVERGTIAHSFQIDDAPSKLRLIAWPNRCGNPDGGGRASLIQDVAIDRTTICPNEEVKVSVKAAHPDGPPNEVDVTMNQFHGDTQYFQFPGAPGLRRISIGARTFERYVDTREVTITVADCPAAALPVVQVGPSIFHPDAVEFTIANPGVFPSNVTYQGDFGDGQRASTTSPFVVHDYTESTSGSGQHTFLTASVTVAPGKTTYKSIALLNRYAFSKRMGTLEPPARAGAITSAQGVTSGAMSIRNIEDTPVTFSNTQIEYQQCDVSKPSVSRTISDNFVVGPKQSVQRQVSLGTAAELGAGVCGVGVHYAGTDGRGTPAVAHLYYTVRENLLERRYVVDRQKVELLNQVAALKGLPPEGVVTDEDIHTLVNSGKVAQATQKQGAFAVRAAAQNNECETPVADQPLPKPTSCSDPVEPKLGEPCDPMSSPSRPGLVCSIETNSREWIIDPPYIRNAQKGDTVMSPGCGVVGALLQAVGQHYSHDGIMTRDRYEITNATASQGLLDDDATHAGFFGAAGVLPKYLRFAWPGAIQQSVGEAFYWGGCLPFELDRQHRGWKEQPLSPSPSSCGGEIQLFYPLVAKASAARRGGAQGTVDYAAEAARRDAANVSPDPVRYFKGGFHYRFFAFTRGDLPFTPGSEGGDWATGTRPGVCSSFVWDEFSSAHVAPTAREADAYRMGAIPASQRGLFAYTEELREAGARSLYSYIYNTVKNKGGTLGSIVGAPDNYAKQLVNCFAFDNCETSGGSQAFDLLQQHFLGGAGVAVSPDDMLLWDVFPTNEPARFEFASYRRPYRWHAAQGTGCISGEVVDHTNAPVAGTTVTIVGLQGCGGTNRSTTTDANGNFTFLTVPILSDATYKITVQKFIPNSGFADAEININAASPACANANISLIPPSQLRRLVSICGTIHVNNAGSESFRTQDSITISCKVNQAIPQQNLAAWLVDPAQQRPPNAPDTWLPYYRRSSVTEDQNYEGRAEASCELKPDNSVTVKLGTYLFGCDDGVLACGKQFIDTHNDNIVVPPGQGRSFVAHRRNEFNDVWADYNLALFNDCQDCFTPVACPR